MNPYIKSKNDQYEAIRASIAGLQERAANESRDLTEDELRSVKDQGEKAKVIADELTLLGETEQRNAKVAAVAAGVAEVRTSTTTAQDRDPGHYRSLKDGGKNSFFGDLLSSRDGDQAAKQRIDEYNRSLSSSSGGAGIIAPHWLTDELAANARQTRRVANVVRRIPISDARTLTLPKMTALTTVTTQSSENSATSFTDAFNTGTDTVTPQAVVGAQKVSRQLLDGSNPSVDLLIYGDLLAAYDSAIEAKVCAAMVTAAGTATTAYATDTTAYAAAITPTGTGVPFIKDLRKAATSVRNLRKLPADIVVAAVSRYGSWLDITDTQGRPLIPVAEYGTVNAVGTGTVAIDGHLLGMDVIATDGLPYQTYPESILVARSQDTILFESDTMRFQFEQPDGPETIRVGIWGYAGVLTRYAGASVQRLQVTAA